MPLAVIVQSQPPAVARPTIYGRLIDIDPGEVKIVRLDITFMPSR